MTEREQITAVGNSARGGALVWFLVDDDAEADRYIAQLRAQFPTVVIVDRRPVDGAVLVLVRGAAN